MIDTHLELFTNDPRYPFRHPENPSLGFRTVQATVENQVDQMREFGLQYAVLINPRFYGWDNSYIADSRRRFPNLFVAHGLIDPEHPRVAEHLAYWVEEHQFQGMRFSPIYHPQSTWLNSEAHYPLWREAEHWEPFSTTTFCRIRCRCWKKCTGTPGLKW